MRINRSLEEKIINIITILNTKGGIFISTFINWVIGALLLWLLSFLPFLNMRFSGIISILVVAVVLGLINALIVPIVKNGFKSNNAVLLMIISLVIDAAALWLAGVIVSGFTVTFPAAIIVAVILSVLNAGFGAKTAKSKK